MATPLERFDTAYAYLLEHGAHNSPLDVTSALGLAATDGGTSLAAYGEAQADPKHRTLANVIGYLVASKSPPLAIASLRTGQREGWLVNLCRRPRGEITVGMSEEALIDEPGRTGAAKMASKPVTIPPQSQDEAVEMAFTLIEQAIAAHKQNPGEAA